MPHCDMTVLEKGPESSCFKSTHVLAPAFAPVPLFQNIPPLGSLFVASLGIIMLRLIVSSSSKPSPTTLLIRRIAPALALSDRQH